jgi:hypothetical protein
VPAPAVPSTGQLPHPPAVVVVQHVLHPSLGTVVVPDVCQAELRAADIHRGTRQLCQVPLSDLPGDPPVITQGTAATPHISSS